MNPIEPDLLYTILCDEVRREDNGKWILLGLFEHIGVSQVPAFHPQCCIVNKWIGGDGAWTQQTRIVDQDDQIVVQSDVLPFELNGLHASFTAVQTFGNVPLRCAATLWIEVYLGAELKQRYPLRVDLVRRG